MDFLLLLDVLLPHMLFLGDDGAVAAVAAVDDGEPVLVVAVLMDFRLGI